MADQYEADTLTKDELTALLRGPAGSTVEMWVGGVLPKGIPRKVELERRSLPQPPLKQARCCFDLRILPGQAHDIHELVFKFLKVSKPLPTLMK
jgi:hypothetical protein